MQQNQQDQKKKEKHNKRKQKIKALKLKLLKKKQKLAAARPKERKYIPFHYVNNTNLRQLIYLIRREPPPSIALVVSYLKPEYVNEILSSLPPDTQSQVAMEMATVKFMTQAELMKFDVSLKRKIDYVVGGLDNLLNVLEKVDRKTLENVLDYLRNEKPELYEKVRKYVIIFDDIPSFPDQAMQLVIREIKSENLARSLRNARSEIQEKVYSNMSASAAAMLKEEMEYGRPVTQEEIEDERKKIVDLIKQMEKDGKIFIREKPKNIILEEASEDGFQSDISGEDFDKYFNAGVECQENGDNEKALEYFEYCLNLQSNNALLYQYLGGVYYALGRTEEAVGAYEKSLELDPDNTELKSWLESQKTN